MTGSNPDDGQISPIPNLAELLVSVPLNDNARIVEVQMPPDVRSRLRERLDHCYSMLREPRARS